MPKGIVKIRLVGLKRPPGVSVSGGNCRTNGTVTAFGAGVWVYV